jgi:CRP-like cAMP-binding protein
MSEQSGTWDHRPSGRGNQRLRRRGRDARAEILGEVPLFRGLAKSHLRKIADASGLLRFDEGQEIVKEGVVGSFCFVIVEGSAKVVRDGRTLKRLRSGDFGGEMSILTGAPRVATIVADSPTECLTLSASALRAVLQQEPLIAVRMLTRVAERLADVQRSATS